MGSDLLFLLRKLKTGSFVSILDTMLAEQPSAQGVLRVYLKTPNAPGQRAFLRCAASFFLEIRQYSCEKMSCATQKSLAAGHIMSFQIHPSIRRCAALLLTSWKQQIRTHDQSAKGSDYIVLVELRGIEPLSESNLTGLSPGAVCYLHSLGRGGNRHAHGLGSVIDAWRESTLSRRTVATQITP